MLLSRALVEVALSQPSDGDTCGWFVELEDGGGALGEGPGAADPPTSKATPPYILSVGVLANVDVGMCTLIIDSVVLFVSMESHDLWDRSLKPRPSCIPTQEKMYY